MLRGKILWGEKSRRSRANTVSGTSCRSKEQAMSRSRTVLPAGFRFVPLMIARRARGQTPRKSVNIGIKTNQCDLSTERKLHHPNDHLCHPLGATADQDTATSSDGQSESGVTQMNQKQRRKESLDFAYVKSARGATDQPTAEVSWKKEKGHPPPPSVQHKSIERSIKEYHSQQQLEKWNTR